MASTVKRALPRILARKLYQLKNRSKPPSTEQQLMLFLREKLGNRIIQSRPKGTKTGFLYQLERLGGATSVRKFEFNGIEVAIKNTYGEKAQGYNYKKIRKTMLGHQSAVRNKTITATRYSLRTPRVIGRIGDYLIMQFIKGKRISEMEKSPPEEKASFEQALQEITQNFDILAKRRIIGKIPQSHHMMVSNTNPQNPAKGKWIFYFPYDFV